MSTGWHIKGDELASCNCDWGCPCQFNARPTHGHCQAVLAFRIRQGYFGDTTLDGLTVAGLYALPGAPHCGVSLVARGLVAERSVAVRLCEALRGPRHTDSPSAGPSTCRPSRPWASAMSSWMPAISA